MTSASGQVRGVAGVGAGQTWVAVGQGPGGGEQGVDGDAGEGHAELRPRGHAVDVAVVGGGGQGVDLVPGPGGRLLDQAVDGEGPGGRVELRGDLGGQHRPVPTDVVLAGGSLGSRAACPRPVNPRVNLAMGMAPLTGRAVWSSRVLPSGDRPGTRRARPRCERPEDGRGVGPASETGPGATPGSRGQLVDTRARWSWRRPSTQPAKAMVRRAVVGEGRRPAGPTGLAASVSSGTAEPWAHGPRAERLTAIPMPSPAPPSGAEPQGQCATDAHQRRTVEHPVLEGSARGEAQVRGPDGLASSEPSRGDQIGLGRRTSRPGRRRPGARSSEGS